MLAKETRIRNEVFRPKVWIEVLKASRRLHLVIRLSRMETMALAVKGDRDIGFEEM